MIGWSVGTLGEPKWLETAGKSEKNANCYVERNNNRAEDSTYMLHSDYLLITLK